MQAILTQFFNAVPHLVGALVVLIVGWIVALVIAAVVRGAVRRTHLDRRVGRYVVGAQRAETLDLAPPIGRAVYYLVLLYVLLAVLQALDFALVTAPIALLLSGIIGFVPQLVGAGVLLLVAWIVATLVRTVLVQALRAARLDERIGQEPGALSRPLGDIAYGLVFLFFLPAVLTALGLTGLLVPVQALLNTIMAYVPRLFSAAVILVVGLFVARLVQRIVTNLLRVAGADRLGERLGLGGQPGAPALSATLGWIVYVLIVVPVITAALNALALGAVTDPISNMLNRFLAAIPNVFAAAVLLALAWAVSRVVASLITTILAGLGFDALPARLGLAPAPAPGQRGLSAFAGGLVQAFIMLFAAVAAANLLGFAVVATLVGQALTLAGGVTVGVIMLGIGLWLARTAARAVRASGTANAGLLATVAQAAILLLVGAMALREMGLANEVIDIGFFLVLGAVAVAAALAFGIGGREVARVELERFVAARRAVPPSPPLPQGGPVGQTPPAGD